jgi:hypothetical protein
VRNLTVLVLVWCSGCHAGFDDVPRVAMTEADAIGPVCSDATTTFTCVGKPTSSYAKPVKSSIFPWPQPACKDTDNGAVINCSTFDLQVGCTGYSTDTGCKTVDGVDMFGCYGDRPAPSVCGVSYTDTYKPAGQSPQWQATVPNKRCDSVWESEFLEGVCYDAAPNIPVSTSPTLCKNGVVLATVQCSDQMM